MKFGVWRFVVENADGEIRKIEVVSTSGKAAKAMISNGEEVLSMKCCTWISGFDARQVASALNTAMNGSDAKYLVEVLRHCGVFEEFSGADK